MSTINNAGTLRDIQTQRPERDPQGVVRQYAEETRAQCLEDTQLCEDWYRRTQVGDPNDYVIAITATSQSGTSGVGKTTLAVTLAEQFDASESGFDASKNAVVGDAFEFAYSTYHEAEKRSALVFDEAQGTLSDSGMDSRRGMGEGPLSAIRAVASYRFKRCTPIIVTQSPRWIDSRMLEQIDALLVIQEKGLAQHYGHYIESLNFKNPKDFTPRIEPIYWEGLPTGNKNYAGMEQRKQDSLQKGGGDDGNDELTSEQKKEIACRMREQGHILETIAEVVDMSTSWVGKHTKDVEKGES